MSANSMNYAASTVENASSSAMEHADIAMRLIKQGLHQQAEQSLAQAITLEPKNAQWHLELARLQRRHDAQLAVRTYDVALELGSSNAILEKHALCADVETIEYLSPSDLWTADRLDISVKLAFARTLLASSDDEVDHARALYRRHILQRTNAKEPESHGKTALEDYEENFISLIQSIKKHGFLKEFAIPIDSNEKILNGAHRLAGALALQLNQVPVVRMPSSWRAVDWGMLWFLQNEFAPDDINQLLASWIATHPDETGLLVIEHHGYGVSTELMATLRQQFPLLGWRDLRPMTSLFPLSEQSSDLPKGPWRYVLVKADAAEFQTFCEQQNAKYAHRAHCRVISSKHHQAWLSCILNESIVAAWHPDARQLPDNAPSLARWMQFGQDTKEVSPPPNSNFVKWRNLRLLEDIHTVIDVGVANGTPDIYNNLKPEHVIFIEPVPLFKKRIEALQQLFPSSQYFPVGLSSRDGDSFINYRKDWPILTSLLASSPLRDTGTEDIEVMPVELKRLDTIFPDFHHVAHPVLMKIDTEGYELEVLKGSVESLKKIKYLVLEVSVIERFKESYTCRELFDFLQAHDFVLHTCLSSSVDTEGFCRVIDAVFCNVALP